MAVYDTHAADLVASIPDTPSRINNLKRRMLPQIEMRVAKQAVQLGEVRRMLGDEHGGLLGSIPVPLHNVPRRLDEVTRI